MFIILKPPLLLRQDLLRSNLPVWARSCSRCNDGLVGARGRALALLVFWPNKSFFFYRLRFSCSLLQASLAVSPHVANHARAARNVKDEHQHAQAIPKRIRGVPVSSHSNHRLYEFSSDAGGIEKHEERVAKPKYWERNLSQEREEVKGVSHSFGNAPRDDHKEKRPVTLTLGNPVKMSPQDEYAAAHLKDDSEDWAGHKAQDGMEHLQAHCSLHHGQSGTDLGVKGLRSSTAAQLS
mmetsp:Transcript_25434/g.46177  ORF Transcript_25434/g.46177 Transcript_25434/m.46177 type:complete len:237 (-) Transcript_25434:147-857(-)